MRRANKYDMLLLYPSFSKRRANCKYSIQARCFIDYNVPDLVIPSSTLFSPSAPLHHRVAFPPPPSIVPTGHSRAEALVGGAVVRIGQAADAALGRVGLQAERAVRDARLSAHDQLVVEVALGVANDGLLTGSHLSRP